MSALILLLFTACTVVSLRLWKYTYDTERTYSFLFLILPRIICQFGLAFFISIPTMSTMPIDEILASALLLVLGPYSFVPPILLFLRYYWKECLVGLVRFISGFISHLLSYFISYFIFFFICFSVIAFIVEGCKALMEWADRERGL